MRKLGKLFSYSLAFLWSFLPWKANLFFGRVLAYLWFDVFKIRQKVIFDNLDIAFKNMSHDQKKMIAKNSTVSMCRSFFDVIKIPSLTEDFIQNQVVFHGLDRFNQIKSQSEKGLLFVTLHLGSGDLGAAVISQTVLPCTLITKRFRNSFLDQFWFSLRGRARTEFIDAHAKSNAYEILAALKKKRGVIFVLDQFMGKPYGLLSKFFGKETGTAYGLALFAKKTQLPVVPIYTHWSDDQKLHIYFGERVALSSDLSETNEEMTNQFNQVLEKIITQHPDHWMWVHRRWKKFE